LLDMFELFTVQLLCDAHRWLRAVQHMRSAGVAESSVRLRELPDRLQLMRKLLGVGRGAGRLCATGATRLCDVRGEWITYAQCRCNATREWGCAAASSSIARVAVVGRVAGDWN
jgi:hypothetical protein